MIAVAARESSAVPHKDHIIAKVGWSRRILATIQHLSKEKSDSHNRDAPMPPAKSSWKQKLRTDMIKRVDDAPTLIDPSGWKSERAATSTPQLAPVPEMQDRQLSFAESPIRYSSSSNPSSLQTPLAPMSAVIPTSVAPTG
jgi:hypothetical protein